MTEKLSNKAEDIAKAALLIREGKLVGFPTETVYGIAALLNNQEVIEELYRIKNRAVTKAFTAHIYSLKQAELFSDNLPRAFYALSEAFFPGPLTIVVKKSSIVPDFVVGGAKTIGIRMPNHKVALELLRLVEEPIVGTSANFSSMPAATSGEEVFNIFEGILAAVINDGSCEIKIASTVIAFDDEERLHILREGAISKTMLEKVCPIC